MPEFSVKKPLTIFCATIAIIVLGIVAYTRMTPDLLPSMDFPYVIIMTTAPGASPETVEETITKPMEQSMATLEHIKTIQSSSSDNYSLVTLEFEEDVNLDTVGVDIQQQISTLQAGWDETVGAPYVLKINPSMLPVMVAAVSMEGMDTIELSEYVDQTLMTELEGITGVARVSTSGSIQQELHVIISQEKLDTLNEKIAKGINAQMDQAAAQLNDAKNQITSALSSISLEDSGMALPELDQYLPDNATIAELGQFVDEQIVKLKQGQSTLSDAISTLVAIQNAINDPSTLIPETPEQRAERLELEAQQKVFDAELEAYQKKIDEIWNSDKTDEEKLKAIQEITGTDEYRKLLADRALVQIKLAVLGVERVTMEPEDLQKLLDSMELTIDQTDVAIDQLIYELSRLETGIDSLTQLAEGIKNNNFGIDTIRTKYEEIVSGVSGLTETAGQLVEGIMSMSVAMMQIENGLSSIESARTTALEQADLNNVLTLQTVSQILAAQNFSMPAGYVEQDDVSYMVSVGDEFYSEEQLGELLLVDMGIAGVDPIYLRDVADVFITDNSDSVYARLNDENGIMLSFEKQSNYATADVSERILDRFEELETENANIKFFPLMDQGDYIYLIVNSILESLLFGMLFSVLVLFLFLKDLRPTFITLIAMPISVMFAIVLMYFSGITLNMISLSGLSIAVGMLVDNSVVVIENIYRLRAKGANAIQAAVSGAKQVAGAIIASTLTTVCVFLPIVFVDGLTRQLFMDLALTMGYALMASLIVALTLVPAMASGMLKKEHTMKKDIMANVYDKYRIAGTWALDHKLIVFAVSLVLLVGSAALSISKGFSFMPEIDMNTVSGTITFAEDTEMDDIVELSDQVIARVSEIEEVETVGAMLGNTSLMGGSSGAASVSLYVTLPEGTSGAAIGQEIEALCTDLPCEVSCASSMMDMSMLTGSGVSVMLYGNDMTKLQDAASTVAQTMENVEGTTEVSDGLEDAATALHINIDRNAAMAKGYTVAQIYIQLATDMTQSATATSFYLDGASIDVVVETPTKSHITADNLAEQIFTQTDMEGNTTEFKLSDVATVEKTVSMNTISRSDQNRYLQVSANVAQGYNVTKVASAVEAELKQLDLPDGIRYAMSGENETIMEALKQLIGMLLLGLMLVYFVMVAQFQSLKSPFIVLFTIPLAFTGGFMGLLLTGMDVSIISMIGFIMLMGIIVNNGIVLVDYINQLRLEGWTRREAILEAGVTRIRPILMTSLTTILGLLVMAIGKDAGTALMQPMAVVCIGGLLYATLMTLFVVPCIYDLMNKKDLRKVDDADLIILDD